MLSLLLMVFTKISGVTQQKKKIHKHFLTRLIHNLFDIIIIFGVTVVAYVSLGPVVPCKSAATYMNT